MGLEPNPQPAHNQEQAGRHMVRGKENVLAAPPAVYPPAPSTVIMLCLPISWGRNVLFLTWQEFVLCAKPGPGMAILEGAMGP